MLRFYTVYANPSDYPGKYVVRAYELFVGGAVPVLQCGVVETLEEARALVPPGYVNLGRYLDEDPVIVESWI